MPLKSMVLLLAFWLLTGLALAQEPPAPLSLAPLLVHSTGPGAYEVKVSVTIQQPLPLPHVPITYSFLRLVAPLRLNGLQEDNLLDSFYEVDLNADGNLDEISVSDREGVLRIDQLEVEPLSAGPGLPETPFRADGSTKRYMLDPSGPEFMVLYYRNRVMGLDLQHLGYRPTVVNLPNPVLQLMVIEPCSGPTDPADLLGAAGFQLSCDDPQPEQHPMFIWEPAVMASMGLEPQWLRAIWVALPLSGQPGQVDRVVRVNCKDDTNPVAVLAQVDYSLEAGSCVRGPRQLGLIWPGAGRPQPSPR